MSRSRTLTSPVHLPRPKKGVFHTNRKCYNLAETRGGGARPRSHISTVPEYVAREYMGCRPCQHCSGADTSLVRFKE